MYYRIKTIISKLILVILLLPIIHKIKIYVTVTKAELYIIVAKPSVLETNIHI